MSNTGTWASTETTDIMSFRGPATTFDPATATFGIDFQYNNLTIVNQLAFGQPAGAKSTTVQNPGAKLYVEFVVQFEGGLSGIGLGNASATFANWGAPAPGLPEVGVGPAAQGIGLFETGSVWINGIQQTQSPLQGSLATISAGSQTAGAGTNVGMAVDLVLNLVWFRVAGGMWNGLPTANPATGVGGYDISSIAGGPMYLWTELTAGYDAVTLNAGATPFAFAIPTGFVAWNTLPPLSFSALALDGYATAAINGPVTQGTITLSTTKADDVIVLSVTTGGYFAATQVQNITDTTGLLTWHRRNRRWLGGAQAGDTLATTPLQGTETEIWWAHAPFLLTDVAITVYMPAGTGSITLVAFGVSGANYTTPWDTNTQAGGFCDNTGQVYSNPPVTRLSTTANNCFLFGIHAYQYVSADAGLAGAPWNYVTSVVSNEHSGYSAFASLAYQVVSQPQYGTGVMFGYIYAAPPPIYASVSVLFDSIVAAGETGTADEIVWFLDPVSTAAILQLTTTRALILSYSQFNLNLMVVVQVLIQSASGLGEVSSITEGSGLVSAAGFQRRSRVSQGNIACEIWWGWFPYTTKASDDVITINTINTAPLDIVAAQIVGIGGATGALGLGAPFWDPNTSLPAVNSSAGDSPPPNVTDMSTNNISTLMVAWTANITVPEQGYTEPYITLVQSAQPESAQAIDPVLQLASNPPPAYMAFEYRYSPGLATNETAEFLTTPEPTGWLMIGDAIPVGPPQPPVGRWASTESPDTFTHTGNYTAIGIASPGGWVGAPQLKGTMSATEHADEFTGAPAFAPWDGIGWLGWVPGHGTMSATETKDHPLFEGWLLGFGRITGQMVAVETHDRPGVSNTTTVTGWLGTDSVLSYLYPGTIGAATEAPDRMSFSGYLIPKALPIPRKQRRLLIVP